MIGIFRKSTPSKDIARDRLKMILVTDRVDTSAKVLEMMKNDILIVLQKYLQIDSNDFDIQICQQSHHDGAEPEPRLKVDMPIKSIRRV